VSDGADSFNGKAMLRVSNIFRHKKVAPWTDDYDKPCAVWANFEGVEVEPLEKVISFRRINSLPIFLQSKFRMEPGIAASVDLSNLDKVQPFQPRREIKALTLLKDVYVCPTKNHTGITLN
jgi:hypothetical protein